MRKITLILLPLLSFSQAVEISKSKTFTELIPPKNMSSGFSLQHRAKQSDTIEALFEKAINIVSKENICKGGKYSIYPNYYYTKNTRVQEGYRSSIRFNCHFDDVSRYKNLLSKIKKLNTTMSQDEINYTINDDVKEKYMQTLENSAYVYAKEHTKFLNKQFNNCKVKSINLRQNQHAMPFLKEMTMAATPMGTKVTAPIKENIKVNLSVDYKFECKE